MSRFQAGEARRAEPGWYPSTYGWARLQYWDGERWTQDYRLAGEDEPARSTESTVRAQGLPDIEGHVRSWQPNRVVTVLPSERGPLNPVGVALALVGAALMIIGVFLPRVESHQFFKFADNTLIQSGDGWIFIALALLIAAAIHSAIRRRRRRTYAVLILAAVGISVATYLGTGARLDPSSLDPVGVLALGLRSTRKASPGAGLYATFAGSGLAALGGLFMAGVVSGRQATTKGEPRSSGVRFR